MRSNAAQLMYLFSGICDKDSMYYASNPDVKGCKPSNRQEAWDQAQRILDEFMNNVADTLQIKSARQRKPLVDRSYDLLRRISVLSFTLPDPIGRQGFIRDLEFAYEKLLGIRDYRSPISLTAFTEISVYCLPALLGPYYAQLGRLYGVWTAYYCAVLVSFLFGCIQNVQTQLDDPCERSVAVSVCLPSTPFVSVLVCQSVVCVSCRAIGE